jgi:hypothetical protein
MSGTAPISLEAIVDSAEQPGMIAAAEQLSEHLTAASDGAAWPVRLNFRPPGAQVPASPTPTAIIVSLAPEASRTDEPFAGTQARWRTYLEALQAAGAPVFVCTVFRHVRERDKDGGASPVLERIRRLNMMAAELSHDLGVAVIDIDRAFAHIGGRILQTDYRQGGVLAAEVAGHTTVWSLLSFGLDEAIDPMVQEKAKTVLGGLQQIDALVGRRLAQRRAAQVARGPAPHG